MSAAPLSGSLTGSLLAASSGPLDQIAARMFIAIAVIVLVARLAGMGMRKLGQPVVLGEILAGISLGPSLLGLFPGQLSDRLFPLEVRPYLRVAAELGLVIFMFVVGLEIDPDGLRRSGRRAAVLSLSSIAVPMALGGLVLAPVIHERYGNVAGESVAIVPFALFMGVAMSGTAFAVLARILTERNMFRIPLGMLAIACAAIDDIVVFALLTMVVSIASSGSLGHLPVALGELVLFVVVLFAVVRPILDRVVLPRYRAAGKLGPDVLALLLAGALASAYVAHLIGLASLIGAFLFGAAVPRRQTASLAHEVSEQVEGVSVVVLLPVFFVVTGLGVDIGGLGWSGMLPLAAVLATACVGKFVGGGVAARLMGIPTRQSLALATLMNTRGLTELVILNVGRSAGLIDGPLFTMMVIMAIVTTVAAGPLLAVVYPQRLLLRDIADAERRRSVHGARYRVGIILDQSALVDAGSADAGATIDRLVTTALGVIGPERPAEVSLYALLGGGDLTRLGATLALTRPAQQRLQQAGLGGRATVRFAGDPQRELLEELKGTTVDCLIVGWSAEVSVVGTIQALADADLADLIVVGGSWTAGEPGVSEPAASNAAVLADLSGTDAAAVAELAARMARHLRAPIHTLSAGRAGRAALEQLERAGYRTSPAGSPGGSRGGSPNGKARTPAVEVAGAAGDGRVAVSVAGLGMGSGGLDVAVVAKVAAAVSLLLLIKGRSGERAALVERVALVGSTQAAD